MVTRRFDKYIDRTRVAAAVKTAEAGTTGEIVVTVAPWFWGRVDRVAAKTFAKLGVSRTAHRNGVLIFVCPRRRRCTIVGDEGIHAVAGQPLWDRAVEAIASSAPTDLTAGLEAAIAMVGAVLALQFPATAGSPNELPDDVV